MNDTIKASLRLSLIRLMDQWIGEQSETNDEWAGVGWIGENLNSLMADAAFAVLMTVTDTNEYLEREDMIKKG